MPRVITDKCVMCGTCAETCPVEAIHPGDSQHFVNPDECIDCGACESGCPSEAIYPDTDLPADKEEFIEKNREFYA